MAHENAARAIIAIRKTSDLIADFELTNSLDNSPQLFTVRGWIMDELERRDHKAYSAWVESDDDSPRKYFLKVNPLCKNCSKLYNGCNGLTSMMWTGCVDRKLQEVKA